MEAVVVPNTSDCPFCKKLAAGAKLPETEVVWQFPHSVALLGQWQYYQGHCMLVARTHATELFNLVEVERRAYLDEMCQLARAIAAVFKPHKMNYELLGNQVPHLHWHLFPRSADDPQRLQAVWLDIGRAERNEGERRRLSGDPLRRDAIAHKLRDKLREITPK